MTSESALLIFYNLAMVVMIIAAIVLLIKNGDG